MDEAVDVQKIARGQAFKKSAQTIDRAVMHKIRRRRKGVEVELAKTEKRLTQATRGMGESAGEMLKAAALQLVAKKLDEVSSLLRAAGFTPVLNFGGAALSMPNPNRADPLATLEMLEAKKFGNEVDANGRPQPQVLAGVTCQICGRPAVYKTNRNMTLCITHRGQGMEDDKADKVRGMMQRGFGNSAAREEIIQVDPGTISAEGDTEE